MRQQLGARRVDVVVVGSGLAGCATALAASDHGLRVLLLEKDTLLGGKTTWSNGGLWIPDNDLAREAGIADSRDEARAYMEYLAAGFATEAHRDAYVDGADAALNYFRGLGLKFELVRNVSDIYYGMAPGAKPEGRMVEVALYAALELGAWRERVRVSPYTTRRATFGEAVRWGGRGSFAGWDADVQAQREAADARALGAGIVAAFVGALLERDVTIEVDAPVRELVVDGDGRISGVVAEIGGQTTTIRADAGVVLATGGYENAPALIAAYDDLPLRAQFPAGLTGDALVMAGEAGATIRAIPRQLTSFLGYDVPAANGAHASFRTAGTHELPLPHGIVVNRAGRRFGDEAFFQKLLNGLREFDVATHRYANVPCFFIFSRSFVEKYGFGGAPVGGVPAFVSRSERVESLATQLGIDPAGLGREIERFNGFAASGVDADFGRGGMAWSRAYAGDGRSANPNLGALDPPFYGVALQPTGGGSAGLLTNVVAQVIGHRGTPLAGLYACGDCAAAVDFGVGYQAGLSLGRSLIFGLAAVRHMSRERTVPAAGGQR